MHGRRKEETAGAGARRCLCPGSSVAAACAPRPRVCPSPRLRHVPGSRARFRALLPVPGWLVGLLRTGSGTQSWWCQRVGTQHGQWESGRRGRQLRPASRDAGRRIATANHAPPRLERPSSRRFGWDLALPSVRVGEEGEVGAKIKYIFLLSKTEITTQKKKKKPPACTDRMGARRTLRAREPRAPPVASGGRIRRGPGEAHPTAAGSH